MLIKKKRFSLFCCVCLIPRINSSSGELEVAGVLDYENVTSYSLVIQATDNTYTTNASYTIQISSVNEYPPVFSPVVESVVIPEDALTNFTFKLQVKINIFIILNFVQQNLPLNFMCK